MLHIRAATDADWPAIWSVLEPTSRRADTYTDPPDVTEEQARHSWTKVPTATFMACDEAGRRTGVAIFGTLTGAFRYPQHGYADAYMMFKQLQQPDGLSDTRTFYRRNTR